jgi:glycosyltransferase involved in cell wall biosynthesis
MVPNSHHFAANPQTLVHSNGSPWEASAELWPAPNWPLPIALPKDTRKRHPLILTVSVVICAYTEERWDETLRAVASVHSQKPAPHQVILVVDYNPELHKRLAEQLPDIRVVPNNNERGLSGARNTGVALATGDIVAFLDDDAMARPGWLSALMRHYCDPEVIGVGGRTEPGWATRRPAWWPGEFDWVVGGTYIGREPGVVRNLTGGNASFRRDLFAIGGFACHIGRSSGDRRPLACEDTEFCIRAAKAEPRGVFVYDDQAVITHHVPLARQSFSYFRSRCLAEGLSKARMTESVGFRAGLATERTYTAVTLPAGLLRGLRRGAHGDWAGLLSAGAIIVGLMYTTLGFSLGLVSRAVGWCREVAGRRSRRPLRRVALPTGTGGVRHARPEVVP